MALVVGIVATSLLLALEDSRAAPPPNIIETFAGGGIGAGGFATNAALFGPQSMAVAPNGDVYFIDLCGIDRVSAGIIYRVSSEGPPCASASLGIAFDPAGHLLVSQNCQVVRDIDTTPIVVAGTGQCDLAEGDDGGAAVDANLDARGLAVAPNGDIYVADYLNCRVRRINAGDGTIETIAGTGDCGQNPVDGIATETPINAPESIALAPNGDLYIGTSCNIQVVSSGYLSGFDACVASTPMAMVVDGAGNLFVAEAFQVREYPVGGSSFVVAGDGSEGHGGDGGPAAQAQLDNADGLALGTSGELYIADQNNDRIRAVVGGTISTFAGTGIFGWGGDGGSATNAGLLSPFGVAVSANNDVYIADVCGVRHVSAGVITTLAGGHPCDWQSQATGDGGPATNADVTANSVAVDGSGDVYIGGTGIVRKVSSGIITTVAGNGTSGFSGDGGVAASAQIQVSDIAVSAAGDLYIAGGCRVRLVSGGVISTVAGNGSCTYSGDGGSATSAGVSAHGIALGSNGNLYIADADRRIRLVSGGTISTVAGSGTGTNWGDGGPATSAYLPFPQDVAVSSTGDLFIVGQPYVRRVSQGVISTVLNNGNGFSGDGGPASGARINVAEGIAVDAQGNVYIADSGNQRVRVIGRPSLAQLAPVGGVAEVPGVGALAVYDRPGSGTMAIFTWQVVAGVLSLIGGACVAWRLLH